MAKLVLKTRTDVLDFLTGVGLLATGGGGSVEVGKELLLKDIELGPIEIENPSNINNNATVCVVYRMGSMAPLTEEKLKLIQSLGLRKIHLGNKFPIMALSLLERFINMGIDVIAPLEIGGSNTPTPISIATSLGKIVVDGDFAGRAIPEITQTTLFMNNISSTPTACADEYGNTTIIVHSSSPEMTERIGKMISVASFGTVAAAGFVMTGKQLKETIIPNTLSEAYYIGRIVREAVEQGDDPAKRLVEKYRNAFLLFKGKIADFSWKDDPSGYMIGTITVVGDEGFSGHTFKIWLKNENHISWLDGRPFVTSPDLITLMDPSGKPLTNDILSPGMRVYVLGFKAKDVWRSPLGLKLLGPQHFGFDIQYRPIEEVIAERAV